VPNYVVERYVPGMTASELRRHIFRAGQAAAALSEEGTPVRHLSSLIVPGDESCYCHFEAVSPEAVEEANVRAGAPFARVVEAYQISGRA
jgi:uncharacterized protein DUF4242